MNKEKTILGEIERRTKKNERHYRKNDGTTECVISNANINYFDEKEQKWKHTDNSLVEKENCYEGNLGNFQAKLSKEAGKSIIDISGKDMSVSWEYLGVNKPRERKTTPAIRVKKKKNDKENLIAGSEAQYKNVDEGIDIQYVMNGNNVKENIIIRKKQNNYNFKFAYKVTGLELRKSEDEEKLELYSPKTNKVEFTIPAPYMYDANEIKSQDVHYEIEATTEDTYILTVVASTEWINAKERKLPVTIDPQLNVTGQQTTISYLTEHYTATTTTGAPKFECTKVVNDIIDLINNDAEYTVVKIDIDTSNIDIDREDIYLANLKLYPVPNSVSIQVKCTASADNGKSEIMYLTLDSNIAYIPITKLIKNSYDNISLIITLNEKSTVTHSFYSFVTNGPKIEIIYADKERQQSNLKTFSLVGGAEAHINMLTGDKTVTIPDTVDENMGVTVSHIFKYSDDDFCCGNDVRLNIHEKLVKNTDTEIESNYIYTDNLGNKHYLKERFYYLVDGEKVYIEDKESITVLPNGKLTIETSDSDVDIEVYREEASYNGLKATTKLESVNNIKYFEQRSDEYKQVEEQKNSYENILIDYVVVDATGKIELSIDENNMTIDGFVKEIESEDVMNEKLLLTKNEALSLKSLVSQEGLSLTLENEENSTYATNLETIEKQIDILKNSSRYNLYYIVNLYTTRNSNDREYVMKMITNYVIIDDNGNLKLKIEYNEPDSLSNFSYLRFINEDGTFVSGAFEDNSENQNLEYISNALNNNNALHLLSYSEWNQYTSLLSQKKNLEIQCNNIETQKAYINERASNNKENFENLYKEYLVLCENLANLKQHIPVNYITSDSLIKGFNENGDLVVIYDNHQKYIVFEYEHYSKNFVEKYRISRIYDDKEREIKLSYNKETNLLNEIRNSNGEITTYEYDGIVLEKIVYSNDKSISISNTDSFSLNSEYFSSKIQYVDGKASVITNSTTIDSIAHNNISTGTSKEIGKTTITYETLETLVLDDMYNGNKYIFDESGRLIEQWEISKSYVTSANKYTYDSEKENLVASISYPKESCLHQTYTGFTFDEKYLKSFTYDTYDRIETEIIEMVDDTINPKVETDAKYTYNENGYVSMVRTKITTEKTNLTTIEYAVQQFEYDKSGNLLCKKSYVEGEELLNGINIEEHIYDKNGFEIKTISYNSLDPSSKIYKECEVDENGQVKSELDQSGMFKTIFEGNTAIQPNGARLSYGYSVKDGNSAVTMSTENGEENSTQKLYTNGFLTRVISGDNVYDYTYDYKGRVASVKINGAVHVNYTYSESGPTTTVTATFADGHQETEYVYPTGVEKTIIDGENSKFIVKQRNNETTSIVAIVENNVTDAVTSYTYDNQGKLVSAVVNKDSEDVYSENYTYNDDGNLTQRLVSFSQGRTDTTTYEYDENTQKLAAINCAGATRIEPNTDSLGRNRGKSVSWLNEKIYSEDITYLKQGDHATALPLTISYGRKTDKGFVIKENIKYKYDNMGNITKVYENGEFVTEYRYDALNRLVRENNKNLNKTCVFLYDNKGNIIKKKEYPFTIKCDEYLELDLATDTIEYTYSNDKLIAYGDKTITYDDLGKLLSYKDNEVSWSFGKRLTGYGTNTFDYDAEGKRTQKNDIKFVYDTEGRLFTQFSQTDNIIYHYDNNSSLIGFSYQNMMYFYKKDLLGNVIEILDNTGKTVVKYTYDAWGNHIVKTYDENGDEIESPNHIGHMNPIRYRSYYFDIETGLYFLQSRYYDPQTGRFISMDDTSYLEPEAINGLNLYAYCGNNPIMRVDPNGNAWWHWLLAIGAVIVVAAATVLTCGAAGIAIGGAGLAGAVIHGAAVGALIGAGIGAVGGAVAGGIYSAVTGADFWTSVVIGAAAGFGIGAIIGAIVGGTIGYTSFAQPGVAFNPKYHSNLPQNGVNPQTVQYGRQRFETKKVIRNLFETIRKGKIEKAITVSREGIVLQGNHRLLIARLFKITIDVIIGGMSQ